ncbi:MAG TPA: glycoside hydrolase [Myxococcota bacterium]
MRKSADTEEMVIRLISTGCGFRSSRLRFAAALVAMALGSTQSARAGLDLPGYVPCFPGSGGSLSTDAADALTVTIDTEDRRQTIRNFGASDAWSIQFIGRWPLVKRKAIADLLFESGLDKANDPRGIALSAWRFNIGAGSSRRDDIEDVWRRADTFYNEDFTEYDWTRLPGQRWFLQAAAERGVTHRTAFVNSPPITMTKNGKAHPDASSGTTNLADGMETAFARYLADVLAHFRARECIAFTEISPVNEPQWDWENGTQEGNRYSNSDIKRVVAALAAQDLGGARIEIPEAGDISSLYSDDYRDYIDAFYDPASPDYLGDVLGHTIAAHSYWSDHPRGGLVTQRARLRAKLDGYPGLEYAMSEYAILGGYGWGRDLGIAPALYIARTAHYDLTVAEASSWQWWLAVSPYDWKDGLVYTDYETADGDFYESKMLWAVGNFSRFIRPGMVRVGVSRSDGSTPAQDVTNLMVSSYFDEIRNIVVVVFVNWSGQSRNVQLDVQGATIDSLIPYVTSAEADLAAYGELTPAEGIEIPGRSIVTLVGYDSEHFFCGDGTCGADENVTSCPSDCRRRGLVRPHKGHSPRPPNVCPGP